MCGSERVQDDLASRWVRVRRADEKAAVEAAAKEFKIAEALRDRLVAPMGRMTAADPCRFRSRGKRTKSTWDEYFC